MKRTQILAKKGFKRKTLKEVQEQQALKRSQRAKNSLKSSLKRGSMTKPIPLKKEITKECIICKEPFSFVLLANKGGKFVKGMFPVNRATCSEECHLKNNKIVNKRAIDKKKNTIIKRNCRQCGKEVVSSQYCPQSFCGGKGKECHRQFLSESRRGSKNPAYRNGEAVKGKRTYTGIHLRACAKYRKAYKEKHDYLSCEVCGVNQNGTPRFEVHHIYFASLFPKHKELHNFKNLILICIGCHNKFHSYKLKEEFKILEAERGLKQLFGVKV
jgi:hypothetical protein